MPVFEITKGGETYEVEASSQAVALEALGITEEDNTFAEDLQGVGQKMLNFIGTGEEIAAGGRAGLGMLMEPLTKKLLGFDYESEWSIDELARRYDEEYAEGQRIEKNLERDAPGVALAAEVIPQMAGGFGVGKALGTAATRGANAMRQGGALGAEMTAYQVGEKEGDLRTRVESLNLNDAAVIAAGTVLGTGAGALMRGTNPDSATLGELISTANKTVAPAVHATADASMDLVKGVGKYTEAVADKLSGGRVSPFLQNQVAPTVKAVTDVAKPVGRALNEQFDKAFTPVRTLAAKRVNATFGARLERGAIQGQRATEEVDRLMFEAHSLGAIRDKTAGNERAMAAFADFGNPELKQAQRDTAEKVLREELGETDYNDFIKFIDDQETLLNKYAPNTQTFKRSRGYLSVARAGDDVATKTLAAQREAGEAASRLSPSDGTLKDKIKLARLSEDGTTVSKVHADQPIMHPLESHHFFMRANAQMGSMNKTLGIRGAQTADEMAEASSGKFYQRQLAEAIGDSTKAEEAVEIYNQVVWGSQRSMAKELQIVRNLGYSGTIANPYGAMLQAHDGFNAAFAHGTDNIVQAMFKNADFKISMQDVGILRAQFNEMTPRVQMAGKSYTNNEGMHQLAMKSQDLLDWAMAKSGFQYGDTVMKGKIMQSGLLQEQGILKNNPSKWRDKWKYTFDKAELDELEAALRSADKDNDLLKQLGLLKLSKLQPISAASNTYYQLSKPNARIFYMLKGFAITQLDLIRNRIKQQYREGGITAAGTDMIRYLALSAGGYGVTHETRQLVKGELPDYSNVPTLAFYQALSIPLMGASGGTDFGFKKFIQNPAGAIVDNYVPPLGPIEGIGKDIGDMLGSDSNPNKFTPDETLKDLPLIGPMMGMMFDE